MKRLCYVILWPVVILSLFTPQSSGPGSVCQWSPDSVDSLDLGDPHQDYYLSKDSRKAEDLAIQYADGHARPGTGSGHTIEEYEQTVDRCETDLFVAVAAHHKVTVEDVRNSLDKHRNVTLDALVALFFGLLYAFFVDGLVRRIWQRFPAKEEFVFGVIATVVISLAVSLLGVVMGEFWAEAVESLRIGYAHLSYRAGRIPWENHHTAIFAAGILVFWLLSWRRYREGGSGGERDLAGLGLFDDRSAVK